jgi:hypothetical protein
MHNIQTYEEYNEGFKTKLATMALGAALSLGTPSCSRDPEPTKTEIFQKDLKYTENSDFTAYKIKGSYYSDVVMVCKSEKVIVRSNNDSEYLIYADPDVEVVYFGTEGGAVKYLYATDDPKYAFEGFESYKISKLQIEEETSDYTIYRCSNARRYIFVPKHYHFVPERDKVKLGNIDAGYTKVRWTYFLVKDYGNW